MPHTLPDEFRYRTAAAGKAKPEPPVCATTLLIVRGRPSS